VKQQTRLLFKPGKNTGESFAFNIYIKVQKIPLSGYAENAPTAGRNKNS
jgi:hypothetical protein